MPPSFPHRPLCPFPVLPSLPPPPLSPHSPPVPVAFPPIAPLASLCAPLAPCPPVFVPSGLSGWRYGPFQRFLGPFPQGSPMENNSRKVRTVQGYQGFSVTVNGVVVSTLVCHGEVAAGGNLEREYTVPEGVRSLWNISESPFEGDGGVRVPMKDFLAICRRHGLEFGWRKL